MFKNPRDYAKLLLDSNRQRFAHDTAREAKVQTFNAARIFPQAPATFWADVLDQIDVLMDEAEQEALASFDAQHAR